MPLTIGDHLKDRNNRCLLIVVGLEKLHYDNCCVTLSTYGVIKKIEFTPDSRCAFVDFECEDAPLLALRCFQYHRRSLNVPMPKGVDALFPGCSHKRFLYLQHVPAGVSNRTLERYFTAWNIRVKNLYRPLIADPQSSMTRLSSRVLIELSGEAAHFTKNQMKIHFVNEAGTPLQFYAIPNIEQLSNYKDIENVPGCSRCNVDDVRGLIDQEEERRNALPPSPSALDLSPIRIRTPTPPDDPALMAYSEEFSPWFEPPEELPAERKVPVPPLAPSALPSLPLPSPPLPSPPPPSPPLPSPLLPSLPSLPPTHHDAAPAPVPCEKKREETINYRNQVSSVSQTYEGVVTPTLSSIDFEDGFGVPRAPQSSASARHAPSSATASIGGAEKTAGRRLAEEEKEVKVRPSPTPASLPPHSAPREVDHQRREVEKETSTERPVSRVSASEAPAAASKARDTSTPMDENEETGSEAPRVSQSSMGRRKLPKVLMERGYGREERVNGGEEEKEGREEKKKVESVREKKVAPLPPLVPLSALLTEKRHVVKKEKQKHPLARILFGKEKRERVTPSPSDLKDEEKEAQSSARATPIAEEAREERESITPIEPSKEEKEKEEEEEKWTDERGSGEPTVSVVAEKMGEVEEQSADDVKENGETRGTDLIATLPSLSIAAPDVPVDVIDDGRKSSFKNLLLRGIRSFSRNRGQVVAEDEENGVKEVKGRAEAGGKKDDNDKEVITRSDEKEGEKSVEEGERVVCSIPITPSWLGRDAVDSDDESEWQIRKQDVFDSSTSLPSDVNPKSDQAEQRDAVSSLILPDFMMASRRWSDDVEEEDGKEKNKEEVTAAIPKKICMDSDDEDESEKKGEEGKEGEKEPEARQGDASPYVDQSSLEGKEKEEGGEKGKVEKEDRGEEKRAETQQRGTGPSFIALMRRPGELDSDDEEEEEERLEMEEKKEGETVTEEEQRVVDSSPALPSRWFRSSTVDEEEDGDYRSSEYQRWLTREHGMEGVGRVSSRDSSWGEEGGVIPLPSTLSTTTWGRGIEIEEETTVPNG